MRIDIWPFSLSSYVWTGYVKPVIPAYIILFMMSGRLFPLQSQSWFTRYFYKHLCTGSMTSISPENLYHNVWRIEGRNQESRMLMNNDFAQFHGPLTRYSKLRVTHVPGMPGTFSLLPTFKETAIQRDARAVMHVGILDPPWRGKLPRHSRRMRNPRFCVSGKRPMWCYILLAALWYLLQGLVDVSLQLVSSSNKFLCV